MVEKEGKCSLNVTFDQHEAVLNMKRGKDTVYGVMDRLLEQNAKLCHLEDKLDALGYSIVVAVETSRELRKEMEKCRS